jgi:hypothetical protein
LLGRHLVGAARLEILVRDAIDDVQLGPTADELDLGRVHLGVDRQGNRRVLAQGRELRGVLRRARDGLGTLRRAEAALAYAPVVRSVLVLRSPSDGTGWQEEWRFSGRDDTLLRECQAHLDEFRNRAASRTMGPQARTHHRRRPLDGGDPAASRRPII